MGAYFEGIVNAYIFIFIICVGEGWKYIEKNYMDNYDCPRYCEVEHDHDMEVSGRFSASRELRYTRSGDDSLWVLHMETEPMDTRGTP